MTDTHNNLEDEGDINSLSPDDLRELLNIAYALKGALAVNDVERIHSLEKNKKLMLLLFQYLVQNIDSPNFDVSILDFLMKYLNIDYKKEKEEEKEEEKEKEGQDKEKEGHMSAHEKETKQRLLYYEVYKLITPNRVAGKTPLETFINNVKLRGVETALKHDGSHYAKLFEKGEPKILSKGLTEEMAKLSTALKNDIPKPDKGEEQSRGR